MSTYVRLSVFVIVLCCAVMAIVTQSDRLFADSLDVPSEWDIECIDCPRYFELSNQSAKLGADDVLRVAYGGDHLYFARETADSVWETELVDETPDVGAEAQLVLDSADNPHIFYHSETDHLKYAHHDGTAWHFDTLGWETDFSVAIDAADHIHLSVVDDTELIYANYDGTDWMTQTVESMFTTEYVTATMPIIEHSNAIAVGSDNTIHIIYAPIISTNIHTVQHAQFDGTVWSTTVVTQTNEVSYRAIYDYVTVVLDSSDEPHIAYRSLRDYGGTVEYAFREGEWQIERVADGTYLNIVESVSSISLLSDGQPEIKYRLRIESVDPYPSISYKDDVAVIHSEDGWEKVDKADGAADLGINSSQDAGKYPEILVDNRGKYHISYYDEDRESVYYATDLSGSWQNEYVASSYIGLAYELMRGENSIGIDENGRLGILYSDYCRFCGEMYYSSKEPLADEWLFRAGRTGYDYYEPGKIENTLEFGQEFNVGYKGSFFDWSLAYDSRGVLHVTKPITSSDPYYSTYHDGEWSTPLLIDTVDTLDTAITLDSDEQPHIVYYDETNQQVKYYTPNKGVSVIDTITLSDLPTYGYDSDMSIDIAIDYADRIHVSYYGTAEQDLKYALYDGTSWETTTVVSEGDVGRWSSITVDGHRFGPQIAYYDATTRDLKMASFHFEPVMSLYLPLVGNLSE